MTQLTDRLEADGLVRRVDDPQDRRAVLAEPTAAGRMAFAQAEAILSAEEEQFLRSLPNDPQELDINCDGFGDFETGWATINSLGVFSPAGQLVDPDGAMLGAITVGPTTLLNGGRLLWESEEAQGNGSFGARTAR